MLVIGIAGGVASGKSLVARCFERFGAGVLDADRVGHEVLKDPKVIDAIVLQFGDIVLQQGKIDRSALGRIVFDPSAEGARSLRHLEEITHPPIGIRIQKELTKLRSDPEIPAVVLDAPVMFKAKWDRLCDKLVFVHADIAQRQQRARQRGWDENELAKRESQQFPILKKQSKSTDLIDNSGSRKDTYIQAFKLWKTWGLPLRSGLESASNFFEDHTRK